MLIDQTPFPRKPGLPGKPGSWVPEGTGPGSRGKEDLLICASGLYCVYN